MSDKKTFKASSAEEVGVRLQESYDHLLASTKKWAEILAFDPYPQTGMTPKEIVWSKNKTKLYRYSSGKPAAHRIPVLCLYALDKQGLYTGSDTGHEHDRKTGERWL